ncbi:Polymeric immunoglobulin receptor [Channa argus]|nr:Polymeric immunoglobulin receptor [Channa argus]
MKILHTLICCFFLSLQDGNFNFVNAQTFTRIKGTIIRVQCPFSSFGRRKYLCKEPCEQNILIETTNFNAQSGRYSIRYKKGSNLHVTITQLTGSDTGQYRCGLGNDNIPFGIIVVDALVDGNRGFSEDKRVQAKAGENLTVACSFTRTGTSKIICKDPCEKNLLVQTNGDTDRTGRHSILYLESSEAAFVHVTITQLRDSDSGLYYCGLGSSFHGFKIVITEAPSKATTPQTSTASFALPKFIDPSEEQQPETATDTEPSEEVYASIPESNQVYEEIGEKRQSRALPVEISAVYAHAKYAKPNEAEDKDANSFGSADCSQHKDQDEMNKLTYCEVNFFDRAAASSNGVLRGRDNEVVYSVLHVAVNSDDHGGEEPALCSSDP